MTALACCSIKIFNFSVKKIEQFLWIFFLLLNYKFLFYTTKLYCTVRKDTKITTINLVHLQFILPYYHYLIYFILYTSQQTLSGLYANIFKDSDYKVKINVFSRFFCIVQTYNISFLQAFTRWLLCKTVEKCLIN